MKRTIFGIAFGIWVTLWVLFIARELFRKGYYYDYKVLSSRSLEGKRSYVTGDRLYEFLIFSKDQLPYHSSFGLVGVKEDSIDRRRASYYLYPHMERDDPEFLLVYEAIMANRAGYTRFAELDSERYILRKLKGER